MEFFFPVHYEIGTALEDVVRSEALSRQQAASLWLIRSQGEGGRRMRRKDVETNMRRWFEVTSAAVSKALRAMMRPPLELIDIIEDPHSGREKLIVLTPKGKAFLDSAAERATAGSGGNTRRPFARTGRFRHRVLRSSYARVPTGADAQSNQADRSPEGR